MPREDDIGKLVPVVFEENGKLSDLDGIYWAAEQALEEGLFADVEVGGLYAFEIVLEVVQHVILDYLQLFVVSLLEILGNWVGEH